MNGWVGFYSIVVGRVGTRVEQEGGRRDGEGMQ